VTVTGALLVKRGNVLKVLQYYNYRIISHLISIIIIIKISLANSYDTWFTCDFK
jgi:hypothetical protein